MVHALIDAVKPDYIQCDCKGCPGLSSYPTKVGNPALGIVKDGLRVWREVTAANGFALVMHYCGLWDERAAELHPSWARVDAEGNKSPGFLSFFSPYVDELLIPQLKELALEYGVDGVWVDADCWVAAYDYSEWAAASYREKTGRDILPKSKDDPNFHEFTEFCREGYRKYQRHYVNALHEARPDFEICCNWAFTSFMPEPVCAGVDFLSGDYTHQDSINTARFEGRCLTRQGKPWDLMAWGFSGEFPGDAVFSMKSTVQLMQEAAQVIALGGGFQIYLGQKGDGSINLWQLDTLRQVAEFVRARQEFCHRAVTVPQIALLNSGSYFYAKSERLFPFWEEVALTIERLEIHCMIVFDFPT